MNYEIDVMSNGITGLFASVLGYRGYMVMKISWLIICTALTVGIIYAFEEAYKKGEI